MTGFYKMIKPMHEKYVRPSEKFADVVIGENYDYELIKIKIDQLLNGNHQKN
jgi:Uridine kinase